MCSSHSFLPFSLSLFIISHNNTINPRGILDDSHTQAVHTHTHNGPWVMQWVTEYSNLSCPVSLASSYCDLDALQWSVCLCVTSLCLHLFLCFCVWLHVQVCVCANAWLSVCVCVCVCVIGDGRAASVSVFGEAGGRRSRDKSAHTHTHTHTHTHVYTDT